MSWRNKTVVVTGPTASGKSDLALKLALQLDGEIINADSVAVYKGFDIGAAKPSKKEMELCPHHLFDLFESHEDCDAGLYAKLAKEAISKIRSRSHIPVVVGGTGLYLRALTGASFHDLPHDQAIRDELSKKSKEELYEMLQANDPGRAAQLHPNDHFRLARALEIFFITGKTIEELTTGRNPVDTRDEFITVTVIPDRDVQLERIYARTEKLIRRGLVAEVRNLLEQGVSESSKPMTSIGYKETCAFIRSGEKDWDELRDNINVATRQFAKRQNTWFRKNSGDVVMENADFEECLRLLDSLTLKNIGEPS